MIYTRSQFGKELKERVLMKQNIMEIGCWAYSIYLNNLNNMVDPDFDDILITLNGMENGPEFAFTYERLNEIADELISGKEINLNY